MIVYQCACLELGILFQLTLYMATVFACLHIPDKAARVAGENLALCFTDLCCLQRGRV
jgi:hypothetical protein